MEELRRRIDQFREAEEDSSALKKSGVALVAFGMDGGPPYAFKHKICVACKESGWGVLRLQLKFVKLSTDKWTLPTLVCTRCGLRYDGEVIEEVIDGGKEMADVEVIDVAKRKNPMGKNEAKHLPPPTIEFLPTKYEQIANHVEKLIEKGHLKTGEAIPSKREMAKDWNVSIPTAEKALGILKKRKVVEARPGEGTYVKKARRKR